MQKDEHANTLQNAIDNLDWSVAKAKNGLEICCGPFDEIDGLQLMAVDLDGKRFLVVGFEGEAEWIDATDSHKAGLQGADAIEALLETYG